MSPVLKFCTWVQWCDWTTQQNNVRFLPGTATIGSWYHEGYGLFLPLSLTMVMFMIRLATDELVLSVCEFENTAHCYKGTKCVSLCVVNKLSSQPVDYPPHWLIFTMYGMEERPQVWGRGGGRCALGNWVNGLPSKDVLENSVAMVSGV